MLPHLFVILKRPVHIRAEVKHSSTYNVNRSFQDDKREVHYFKNMEQRENLNQGLLSNGFKK